MTFDEALILKKSLPYIKYQKEGLTYHVLVTPNQSHDMNAYHQSLPMTWPVSDDFAKSFSSDGLFVVRGVFFDGRSILFEKIDVNS